MDKIESGNISASLRMDKMRVLRELVTNMEYKCTSREVLPSKAS